MKCVLESNVRLVLNNREFLFEPGDILYINEDLDEYGNYVDNDNDDDDELNQVVGRTLKAYSRARYVMSEDEFAPYIDRFNDLRRRTQHHLYGKEPSDGALNYDESVTEWYKLKQDLEDAAVDHDDLNQIVGKTLKQYARAHALLPKEDFVLYRNKYSDLLNRTNHHLYGKEPSKDALSRDEAIAAWNELSEEFQGIIEQHLAVSKPSEISYEGRVFLVEPGDIVMVETAKGKKRDDQEGGSDDDIRTSRILSAAQRWQDKIDSRIDANRPAFAPKSSISRDEELIRKTFHDYGNLRSGSKIDIELFVEDLLNYNITSIPTKIQNELGIPPEARKMLKQKRHERRQVRNEV